MLESFKTRLLRGRERGRGMEKSERNRRDTWAGEALRHPFPPLFDAESRVLILGSFPSVRSREQGFFYGYPQNRFWPLLAGLFGEPVPVTIPEKRELVLSHQLALWDAVGECRVTGSADASIRDVRPNDLNAVLSAAPIRGIFCNGATAWQCFRRYCQADLGLEAVKLPSTSPANARWSLERLKEVWGRELLPLLQG